MTKSIVFPRRLRNCLGIVLGLALSHGSASAIGLLEAYDLALKNDPTFRIAGFDRQAGKEYRIIGRSALLPNVSASITGSKNRADIEADTTDILGRPTTSLTHPTYFSRGRQIALRQPLFNMEALARYKQGIAQSNYAESLYDGQSQELIMRVYTAYVDALFSNEIVALATAQRDMYLEQKQVNDRLFKGGEGTRTDMLETQARLDLSEAQLIEAKDNQLVSLETLSGIVGLPVTTLTPLAEGFRPAAMPAPSLDDWKLRATRNNPELMAQQFLIESARQEMNKARAGHLPRVDLVASYSKNDAETVNTYNQDATNRSIGFQMNIPLYAGGQVSAVSRQTVAGFEKAKAELQAKTDKLMVDVRKNYAQVISSSEKIEALIKAVESSQLLVRATEQSIKGGVRINLDLLNARQQLFTSQRDLAQSRFTYLAAMMRLRATTGALTEADIRAVAGYFR